ncbi:helix-turn-helix protein, CopG [Candidatus Scalindua japonica]|uniref:Helix-turn-helix protein, CopG n=1 Tax=Candidatus Scalindua japonica TaxID=1284222 RepID=A0A286TZ68_9BACT|nr:CopG family transcriptional regulator [Candidatus Scalindua japonica]GAX61166.1 helix-turn-helix protein, CopG [Candidatus Scalindua japonica]
MSKTVTLRLDDKTYNKFRDLAKSDNRPISNFIETAVLRFVESNEFVDEFEIAEIRSNSNLNNSIKRGLKDVKSRRGNLV